MDLDLTANAFRRFVRRRGLHRPDGVDVPDSPAVRPRGGGAAGASSSGGGGGGGGTSGADGSIGGHHHYDDDMEHESIGPQHRASSTYVRPRDMHGHHRAGANYPHADGNIRRTQSQVDAGVPQSPQSPPRRLRNQDDDGSRKQYRCEFCTLQFGRKHHKERHVANIHRHEKPYVCNMCGHPFHQKPNLDRHRATVHAEVTPFRCDDCGATFHRRNQLRSHMQTVHDRSRRQECTICRMSLANAHELNEHMRTEHTSRTRHARVTR